MPLSDHEQRLLDEIEQALYAEDPKFASSVRSVRRRSRLRTAVVTSVLGVLVGLACVLVGLVTNLIVLSVVGFVLVVGACGYLVQRLRPSSPTPDSARDAHPSAGPARTQRPGGLRGRMEERLRKRFDES
ncbi:MAG: DUF3040 domain-containing protein [Jatrophihabitans sp.]|nr:MAG: DUF3040 domain-containing protein [Jatrophihabitans sp.]